MNSFTEPENKAPLKRGLKTPARLGVVAARLFATDGSSDDRPDAIKLNASVSSAGSVTYDQMYLDQCHKWFTRETRAAKTPKPNPVSLTTRIKSESADQRSLRKKSVTSKPRMKAKRMTKCLERHSSLPSDGPRSPSSGDEVSASPGCAGCTAERNSEISSSNLFKLLSNNVLICSAHRFITQWMIDYWKGNQTGDGSDFRSEWRPESADVQADQAVPFSVIEDRRVVAGVGRFGNDAWETILSEFYFVPSRKPADLKIRWQQLQQL